jgi:hypothetical protein
MGSAFSWALKRAGQHLDRFLVGGIVLGVAVIGAGNVLAAPRSATALERFGYSVAAFLVAALLAVSAAYGWALFRAPYEQRNALRTEVKRQEADLSAVANERDQLLAQNQESDLSGSVLHHQTIRLGDLPMDGQGIVRGKRFEHCVIKGPGLIAVLTGTNLVGLKFQGSADSLVWVAPQGPVIGAVGLEYCQFLDCRIERVAVAASVKQAPYLKEMLSGQIKGYKVGDSENGITVIE